MFFPADVYRLACKRSRLSAGLAHAAGDPGLGIRAQIALAQLRREVRQEVRLFGLERVEP